MQVRFQDGSVAFDDLKLAVSPGEFVAIAGPSGCGKTTLLRCLAGLQDLTSGTLQLEPAVEPRRGGLGFVFQGAALMPWRSAWQNVALPLELLQGTQRPTANERKRIASEWLLKVGLQPEDFEKRPDQLSGGMQMRVSIARALVTEPTVLLLDEPFAALDDMLRQRLGQMLQQIWMEQGRTVVLVTHNLQEAVTLSQRVVVMNRGGVVGQVAVDSKYPRKPEVFRSEHHLACVAEISGLLEETS
ncbi:Bicarbonate transport ATP-binding protein CmpD [Roseimaritima multifibrata]|uniref:Bicarbonate transport ATP-binding protein CmpD n=2 Tax=Roseimaritima multifibrata TaxID=1930274 RepID=A0A517MCF7_9BACT|nr:Bicarbonate transport ATP-binding protein CmpD [Roseimaritima multifibrata]